GWVNRDAIRLRIASVYAPVPPKPEAAGKFAAAAGGGVRGDAAWALSVFPECLSQVSRATGPREYVLAHLPKGAAAVTAPATLTYGDCTIVYSGSDVRVRRGTDQLRIPPLVRLYRAPGALAVLHSDGSGGNDLRVYEPVRNPNSNQ
ncbi:MAG TPA: hypothetical protein VFU90_12500, partial [Candidatus Tumulicola sp.]|nr:hypothetical protein [Candidatus Tumulicola sp.]